MSFLAKVGKFFDRALGSDGSALLQAVLYAGSAAFMVSNPVLGIGLLVAGAILQVSQLEYEKSLLEDSIKDDGHLVNTVAKVNSPIPIVYGKTRVGGNIIFQKTAGANNKDLLQVMTLSEGKIKGVYDIQLDEQSIFPATIENTTTINKKSNNLWEFNLNSRTKAVKIRIKANIFGKYYGYDTSIDEYSWLDISDSVEKEFTIKYGDNLNKNLNSTEGSTNGVNFVLTTDNCINLDFTTLSSLRISVINDGSIGARKEIDDYDDFYTVYNITNANVDIESVEILNIAYDDNGDGVLEWNVIDDRRRDYMDYLYFDGYNLYRIQNLNSTTDVEWNLVDENDDMFKWYVDNGFMKETTDGSYLGVLNKLRELNVAMLFVSLIYNKDVWKQNPQIAAVVEGRVASTPFNQEEHLLTNPVEILYDYMTNTTYGTKINESKLDIIKNSTNWVIDGSWYYSYKYCLAKGWTYNGVIKNGKIDEIISSILLHFRGDLIYQFGKYKVIFKDMKYEVDYNLHYPDLVELEEGNDTFNISYSDLSTSYNQIEATFINETINYKADKILVPETLLPDEAPNKTTLSLHGCNYKQAKALATYNLERSRMSTTISFMTSAKYIDLQVGQLFKLTYKDWGIENQWFRCTSIKPNLDGNVQIEAIIEDSTLYNDIYERYAYDIDITYLKPIEEMIIDEINNKTFKGDYSIEILQGSNPIYTGECFFTGLPSEDNKFSVSTPIFTQTIKEGKIINDFNVKHYYYNNGAIYNKINTYKGGILSISGYLGGTIYITKEGQHNTTDEIFNITPPNYNEGDWAIFYDKLVFEFRAILDANGDISGLDFYYFEVGGTTKTSLGSYTLPTPVQSFYWNVYHYDVCYNGQHYNQFLFIYENNILIVVDEYNGISTYNLSLNSKSIANFMKSEYFIYRSTGDLLTKYQVEKLGIYDLIEDKSLIYLGADNFLYRLDLNDFSNITTTKLKYFDNIAGDIKHYKQTNDKRTIVVADNTTYSKLYEIDENYDFIFLKNVY